MYPTWCDVLLERYFALLFRSNPRELENPWRPCFHLLLRVGTKRRCMKECVTNRYRISAKCMVKARADLVRAYMYWGGRKILSLSWLLVRSNVMFRRILTLYGIDEEKKFRTFIGDNKRSAVQILLSLSLSPSKKKQNMEYFIFHFK